MLAIIIFVHALLIASSHLQELIDLLRSLMHGRLMSWRFACLLEFEAVQGGSASSFKICMNGTCRTMFSRLP